MRRECGSPRTRPSPATRSRSSAGPARRRGGRPTAWCSPTRPPTGTRIAEAVALARDSDVAIVVVGDNEQTAREAYAENHLGDRPELRLVGQQEDLVARRAGHRQADRAGADQRPPARDPGAGRARPRPSSRAGTWARRAAPPWPKSSSAT